MELETIHNILKESDVKVLSGLPEEVFIALVEVVKYFRDKDMRYWRAMGVCSIECLELPRDILKQCGWVHE